MGLLKKKTVLVSVDCNCKQKKVISIWIWLRGDKWKKNQHNVSDIVYSLTAKIDSVNITCLLYDLVVLAWFGYFEKKNTRL